MRSGPARRPTNCARPRWPVASICLALVVAACSAQTPVAEPTADSAPITSTAAPAAASTAAPAPTTEPSPTVAPTATSQPPPPTPEPLARYTDRPTSDFVAPASWSEPFPLHPDTIETTLDNGLRVVVRRNTAPGRQAQLRLVVPAGSLDEQEPFLGAAHFLEHMMFNGTERFPGNALIPVLESFGAAFGPDVNAYTSYEATVYLLTVPATEPGALELGLDVLAEWASRASIEPEAVVAERGVVREERRRSQETVGGRLGQVVGEVLLGGTAYVGRDPIGTLDAIDTMMAPELRDFYERWYRPDLMSVIAVGDFDPATVVGLVEAAFGSLAAPAEPAPTRIVESGPDGLPEPVFDVYTDPELIRTEVSVSWRTAASPVFTPVDLRAALARELAVELVDRRLFELVERGGTRSTDAGSSARPVTPDLSVVGVRARSSSGEVSEVLVDVLTAVEQARQHPFDEGAFALAVARLRSGFEQAHAQAGRRQDGAIAAGYTRYVLGEGIESDPDVELDLALEVLDSLEPVDAQVAIDALLRTPPYVLVTAPESDRDRLPDPAELAAVYDAVIGSIVDAAPAGGSGPDTLLEPPEPAAIVADEVDTALGARVVTYDNGVRLAVRSTEIVDNRVRLQAWSRGGFFQEDAARAPLLGWATSFVVGSGFASIDPVDVDQLIGDRVVELGADVTRAVEVITGSAATEDLETLLALVHLQMTEPTVTEVAVRRFEETWRPIAENPQIRPDVAGDLALWRLRYGDSPWFRRIPSVADLDALDVDRQLDAWEQRFDNAADFVFVVVGDLDVDVVVELGARYLGTLPATDEREDAVDRDPGLPEANLVETVEAGVGDRARLRINWESPYPFTLEAEIAARALELMVNARLRDVVREDLGAAYAPSATVSVVREPRPWVDTIIELQTDPGRIVEVSEVVRAELAAIRAGDIDPAYLERAVDQMVERFRFVTNPEWIDRITFHLAHPDRPSSEYRDRAAIARSLTIADLADVAGVVFPETRSVEVRLVPAA